MLHTVTQAQIDAFLAGVAKIHGDYMARNFSNLSPEQFSVEVGGRYARIVRAGPAQRSVHCFIDLTNGNVLKAASWKAPEKKNPRGNLNDARQGLGQVTEYGVRYLR